MDPTSTALLLTIQLVGLAVELDQVPDDVRRCLELVQTCHRDTQHLIEMRNQNIMELQKRPKELAHVDAIIISASDGLREVSKLVEKCRPEANRGHTHLGKRLRWKYADRDMFHMQRPIIERHHTSVVTELNYVRQIGLLSQATHAGTEGAGGRHDQPAKTIRTVEFENIHMLGVLSNKNSNSNTAGVWNIDKTPSVLHKWSPAPVREETWDAPQNHSISREVSQICQSPTQPVVLENLGSAGTCDTAQMTSGPYHYSPHPAQRETWDTAQNASIYKEAAQKSWPYPQPVIQQPPPPPYAAGPVSEELRAMNGRFPQGPMQSIYSDPRKSLGIHAKSLQNQRTTAVPAVGQPTSMCEDQGLAALLGGFAPIPAFVESNVVNQNTNFNAPINITVHVNNYPGQPGGLPLTSTDNNVSGGADINTAMEVAHAQLQNLPLYSPSHSGPFDHQRNNCEY